MLKKHKIFILMCHWIGDTFWAMQVIPAIKEKYPESKIWVGVKSHSKDLLYELIDKDKIIILKNIISDRHREKFNFKEYLSEIKRVRKEKFDLSLDLTGNRYSAIFLTLARIPVRVGINTHKLNLLYSLKSNDFDKKQHQIHRYFHTVKSLIPKISFRNHLFTAKTKINGADILDELNLDQNRKLALLIPGAGWKSKQWDRDNFIKCGQFLNKKGYNIIIAGSINEKKLCQSIAKHISDSNIFNRSLNEFIALIANIDIAITNDSGPAHLIAAENKKLLTVFCGDTSPKLCKPIGNNVIVMKKKYSDLKYIIEVLKKIK